MDGARRCALELPAEDRWSGVMDDWDDTPEGDGTGRRNTGKSPLAIRIQQIRSSQTYKKAMARFRQECSIVRNRDGSRGAACGICGGSINYRLAHPHPDSWSCDHVIPMSQRPDLALERKNWQPAHLGCNSSKGNSEDVLAPGCLGVPSEVF